MCCRFIDITRNEQNENYEKKISFKVLNLTQTILYLTFVEINTFWKYIMAILNRFRTCSKIVFLLQTANKIHVAGFFYQIILLIFTLHRWIQGGLF